jgi:hypothetical protein
LLGLVRPLEVRAAGADRAIVQPVCDHKQRALSYIPFALLGDGHNKTIAHTRRHRAPSFVSLKAMPADEPMEDPVEEESDDDLDEDDDLEVRRLFFLGGGSATCAATRSSASLATTTTLSSP